MIQLSMHPDKQSQNFQNEVLLRSIVTARIDCVKTVSRKRRWKWFAGHFIYRNLYNSEVPEVLSVVASAHQKEEN